MAVYIDLTEMLEKKGITFPDLISQLGLTSDRGERLRAGNFTSIRLSTVDAMCDILDCEPGDLIKKSVCKY